MAEERTSNPPPEKRSREVPVERLYHLALMEQKQEGRAWVARMFRTDSALTGTMLLPGLMQNRNIIPPLERLMLEVTHLEKTQQYDEAILRYRQMIAMVKEGAKLNRAEESKISKELGEYLPDICQQQIKLCEEKIAAQQARENQLNSKAAALEIAGMYAKTGTRRVENHVVEVIAAGPDGGVERFREIASELSMDPLLMFVKGVLLSAIAAGGEYYQALISEIVTNPRTSRCLSSDTLAQARKQAVDSGKSPEIIQILDEACRGQQSAAQP